MPLLWLKTGTTGIHKIVENSCGISTPVLNIPLIIYLHDMLVSGRATEETLMSCQSLIYILQFLDFVINLKKSILTPVKETEFLGMIVNSREMTLSLPK